VACRCLSHQLWHVWYVQAAEAQPCMGGCGRAATVKIQKRCDTCSVRIASRHDAALLTQDCVWMMLAGDQERADCFCEPGWCHHCLLKWWMVKNQSR
jgi:hypothetical protein